MTPKANEKIRKNSPKSQRLIFNFLTLRMIFLLVENLQRVRKAEWSKKVFYENVV